MYLFEHKYVALEQLGEGGDVKNLLDQTFSVIQKLSQTFSSDLCGKCSYAQTLFSEYILICT